MDLKKALAIIAEIKSRKLTGKFISCTWKSEGCFILGTTVNDDGTISCERRDREAPEVTYTKTSTGTVCLGWHYENTKYVREMKPVRTPERDLDYVPGYERFICYGTDKSEEMMKLVMFLSYSPKHQTESTYEVNGKTYESSAVDASALGSKSSRNHFRIGKNGTWVIKKEDTGIKATNDNTPYIKGNYWWVGDEKTKIIAGCLFTERIANIVSIELKEVA